MTKRSRLADRTITFGHTISPCSRCLTQSLACAVIDHSDRCGPCLQANVPYGAFTINDSIWASYKRQKEKLGLDEDANRKEVEDFVGALGSQPGEGPSVGNPTLSTGRQGDEGFRA
jgi:hypothetical protein